MNAVITSNCLVYATPAHDITDARKKNQAFERFMDTLEWDILKKKAEAKNKPRTAEDTIKQLFGGARVVPFRNRSKTKDDK